MRASASHPLADRYPVSFEEIRDAWAAQDGGKGLTALMHKAILRLLNALVALLAETHTRRIEAATAGAEVATHAWRGEMSVCAAYVTRCLYGRAARTGMLWRRRTWRRRQSPHRAEACRGVTPHPPRAQARHGLSPARGQGFVGRRFGNMVSGTAGFLRPFSYEIVTLWSHMRRKPVLFA
jgi:hypothetical protein